ncbi:MAG TPA: MBL fold metallo-hydrolase [Clostridiaceae bacterium]|nr:MBL fold metallo-hydrolase [Clostridiaceae bacterium]
MKQIMSLHMLNVGYGDAFLFMGPFGTCMLDVGGNLPEEFVGNSGRTRACDWLNSRGLDHLDHLILTHIHEDHVGGLLPLLQEVKVDHVWTPFPTGIFDGLPADLTYDRPIKRNVALFLSALCDYVVGLRQLRKQGAQIHQLCDGDSLSFGALYLDILSPISTILQTFVDLLEELKQAVQRDPVGTAEEQLSLLHRLDILSNGASLVIKFSIGAFVGLFCADNTPSHWSRTPTAAAFLQDVNVIKLPHHGQIDAIDAFFMQKMPLQICLTTSSSTCKYNSANPEVYRQLEAWAAAGNRTIDFLFSDPPADHPYWSGSKSYSSVALTVDANLTYDFATSVDSNPIGTGVSQ